MKTKDLSRGLHVAYSPRSYGGDEYVVLRTEEWTHHKRYSNSDLLEFTPKGQHDKVGIYAYSIGIPLIPVEYFQPEMLDLDDVALNKVLMDKKSVVRFARAQSIKDTWENTLKEKKSREDRAEESRRASLELLETNEDRLMHAQVKLSKLGIRKSAIAFGGDERVSKDPSVRLSLSTLEALLKSTGE